MKPKVKLILSYEDFFGEKPPDNPFEIIKDLSKLHIIYEIAGLNYRLKPKNSLYFDTSEKRQIEELKYFCPSDIDLRNKYFDIYSKNYNKGDKHPIIFNRACNLLACELILNSEKISDIDGFDMRKTEVWDAIFKFLLAVNSIITYYRKAKPEGEKVTFEDINAANIALNELMIETDPLITPYRGLKLLEFLKQNEIYSNDFKNYFKNVVKSDPQNFIYQIMSMYMINKQKNPDLEFSYRVAGDTHFFDYLSENTMQNTNPITLLSLKKAPFYKEDKGKYAIIDILFLIEKTYNFLVNDFWFDYLKGLKDNDGKEIHDYRDYRGQLGYFFENYVSEVFLNCFHFFKHPKPLTFDELKFTTPKGDIEFADLYLRQNKKILIGQVKFTSIYDKEKYSGEINGMYRNDRVRFYKDFGVNQLVESIKSLEQYYTYFDKGLAIDRHLRIFPIIIVNDKALQTPLMAEIFNERFKELITDINKPNYQIYSLTLIHISELERFELTLASKNASIWDILANHYKNDIIPPFYNTVNKYIGRINYPDRVMKRFEKLVEDYQPKKTLNKT